MPIQLPDVTLPQVLQRIVAALVVSGVYGFVAAAVAGALGDRGPAHDGRRTLSPFGHLDVFGVVAAVFFRVTWVRPIDLDVRETRQPRLTPLVLLLANVLAMAGLGAVALLLRQVVTAQLPLTAALQASSVLSAVSEVAVATAVVGLLPLPPLLGGSLWAVVSPGSERLETQKRFMLGGYVVVFALLLSGVLNAPSRALWQGFARLLGF